MSKNSPLLIPNGAPMAAPQLVVAQPINDLQLVALVAAKCEGVTARECVAKAVELVAESIVAIKGKALEEAVKKIEEAG